MNIYQQNGFKNRRDYLTSLVEDFDVDIVKILMLADILGPDEDFDALLTHLEDLSLEA